MKMSRDIKEVITVPPPTSSSQVRCDSKERVKPLPRDLIMRIEESVQHEAPKHQPYVSVFLERF